MITLIRELVERRELLFMFVFREIQVKYKQSVMGILWAVFMPMMVVATGILVRYAFAIVSGKPLDPQVIASVSVKAIPWAFVVSAIRFSSMSLIGHRNLVTKIYFPRAIFPVAAVLSQVLDLLVAGFVLAVVLALAGLTPSPTLVAVPFLLAILFGLVIGIGLLTSAASLFFRDVKYLIEVVLSFAIFVTPVFYEAELFGKYETLLLLNPVAPILEGLRNCVVLHIWPDWGWTFYALVCAVLSILTGFYVFRRLEPAFAESI